MGSSKHKARVELNFFHYSDIMVKYDEDSNPQYDLILGTETMKELGIVLDFKAKAITVDEITLPMRNINHLHRHRLLRALKLKTIA